MDEAFVSALTGGCKRILVEMPPRHGKSEFFSRWVPSWYLGTFPENRIILSSYEADYAATWGMKTRDTVNEFGPHVFGVKVSGRSSASNRWEIEGHEGGMQTAGAGGAITGKGANCLVADTMVITDDGPVPIQKLRNHVGITKVLSHGRYGLEYKTITAFRETQGHGIYRITTASGRVVESTGEHRFHVRGKWTEACSLAAGDALMLAVPKGVHATSLRNAKGNSQEVCRSILLESVQSAASRNEESPPLCQVPKDDGQQNAEVLPRMPRHTQQSAAGLSSARSGLPDMQPSVSRDVERSRSREVRRILRPSVCQHRALAPDVWQRKPEVEEWNDSTETATAFSQGVPLDASVDSDSRRAYVRGVRLTAKPSCSPSRRDTNEQRQHEPSCAVQQLPSVVARGEGFTAVEDVVAVVERTREDAATYDIQVKDNHSFFANGILVHNCLIVDDPIKNHVEAFSPTIREKVWDWWCSTAYTRLEPDGVAVVIHTRWHEDDLIGRLRKDMEAGGEQWNIISFPAINDRNEALWPERYPLVRLRQIERQVGGYFWNALYQQRPTAKEGSFFKIGNVKIVDAVPAGLRYVRAWDLAATEDDGDYTAGVKIGTDGNGQFFIVDVERGQWATDERDRRLRSTAERDGKECKQRLPEDPGQAGKSQALSMTRLLAGFSVKTVRVSGDKQTRADPLSSQFNAGNVSLLSDAGQDRKWVRELLEEFRTFPRGKHDDQVDAAADAFDELAQRRTFMVAGMDE